MSVKEFAVYIRVHPNTVRRMIASGRLNAFRLGEGPKSPRRIAVSEANRLSLADLEKIVKILVKECLQVDANDSVC